MAMAKMLVIVTSGPDSHVRAREGLTLVRAIHETGMAESVSLLLFGEGVRCLSSGDERCMELHEELERVLGAGVHTAACTRSLEEHRLLDAVERLDAVEPVGAPVFLSSRADDGYAMLTF